MAMKMIERNKKLLKKRINEIIDDYLFDKDLHRICTMSIARIAAGRWMHIDCAIKEEKMSEKQMEFLDELERLLSKYEIDVMSVTEDADLGNCVDFISHGQKLSIGFFAKGEFRRVRSFYGDYDPKQEEKE